MPFAPSRASAAVSPARSTPSRGAQPGASRSPDHRSDKSSWRRFTSTQAAFQTIGLRFAQDSERPGVSRCALAVPCDREVFRAIGDKSRSSALRDAPAVLSLRPESCNAQGPDDWLNGVARRLLHFRAVGRSVWTRGMVRGGVAASRRPTTAPDGSDPRDRGRLFFVHSSAIRWKRGIDSPSAWLSAVHRQASSAHVLFRPLTGRSILADAEPC